jgi:hypothetical protein
MSDVSITFILGELLRNLLFSVKIYLCEPLDLLGSATLLNATIFWLLKDY